MDLEEYNAIQETLHLTSNATNRQRLTESLQEMNAGAFKAHKLMEKYHGIGVSNPWLGRLFILAGAG